MKVTRLKRFAGRPAVGHLAPLAGWRRHIIPMDGHFPKYNPSSLKVDFYFQRCSVETGWIAGQTRLQPDKVGHLKSPGWRPADSGQELSILYNSNRVAPVGAGSP